ncbi:Putative uncharacterized protein [Taphrina deformans PYCC 5710]|uniref:Transmembrane protein 19 n=1 Tax=Taphrina deformans (strain PYCC 5710 / ATCC 11124 / CBS 356.35 / IMI 108563 / JCM 9778 / NBRC 8474) TaxID=1097556 RepID=R4XCT1_TAPDE|nr:Putative uncharacterized protein [Taphrina deformans PYCC 5710]|eukprot:CCG81125.1 Putative uncharacterized protein [Taphrina deformans PYCC 5710]
MLAISLNVQTMLGLLAVVYMAIRSHRRSSLTQSGILAALIVGTIHALHPFRILSLLLVFFVCGTKLTTWGSDIKEELLTDEHEDGPSISAARGKKKKEGRTATQVFCNAGPATLLCTIHLLTSTTPHLSCLPTPSLPDLLIFGTVAQYACSAGDTFSSEIGILNDNWPILITTLRNVPPGTNGAVSLLGLVAALMGGTFIGLTAAITIPCDSLTTRLVLLLVGVGAGLCGSLIDSLLGATCQQTIYNAQMKKVVEVHGGSAAPVQPRHRDKERYIVLGHDLLDNNQVNLLSALLTVLLTMITVTVCSRLLASLPLGLT